MKKYSTLDIEARMSYFGMDIPYFHFVFIRSEESIPDRFDDHCYMIAHHNNQGFSPYECTTNPGKYWLEHLMNKNGTAIIEADKQYKNCYQLGLHKGKHALIQCGVLSVFRDANNNGKEDEYKGPFLAGPECRIDIHGANSDIISRLVGKWSAGCLVIADPNDLKEILSFCKATAKSLFTITVLNEW